MLGRSAVVALLIGSNWLAGCSAHQTQAAGGTIGLLGGMTTIVGIGIAAGCEPFPDDEETTCETDSWEPDPENGLRVMGAGLFVLGVGALLYVTGAQGSHGNSTSSPSSKSRTTPEESWTPTPPLDRFEPTEASELPEPPAPRETPESTDPPPPSSDSESDSGW
jgi:hypothetical protein